MTRNISGRTPAAFALKTGVIAAVVGAGYRLACCDQGVVAVEAALIMPALAVMLLGMIAVGDADVHREQLQGAALADANSIAAGNSPSFVAALGGTETSSCAGSCSPMQPGATVTVSAAMICASLLGHPWPCAVTGYAVRP